MAMPGENGQLVSLSFDLAISGSVTCGLAKKSDTEVISFLSVFLAIVAQVLRTHVTSLGARDHLAQVATVASLVYADRLNQPPIYPGDPNTVEEVSTRFSEILGDHLDLAAIILSSAGGMLNTDPVRLLDEIVVTRLGSYS